MAKQAELPGIERKLKDLHDCALEYAEKRDARQALLAEEVDLKVKLLALMKKYKKETYEYNGVSIQVVHEEETVKVRIKEKKEADEEDAA